MSADREPGASAPLKSDIRAWELSPSIRHATIFAAIDALGPDEALRLHADHEPKPLSYMVQAERPGRFAWDVELAGPEEWIIRITRVSSLAAAGPAL